MALFWIICKVILIFHLSFLYSAYSKAPFTFLFASYFLVLKCWEKSWTFVDWFFSLMLTIVEETNRFMPGAKVSRKYLPIQFIFLCVCVDQQLIGMQTRPSKARRYTEPQHYCFTNDFSSCMVFYLIIFCSFFFNFLLFMLIKLFSFVSALGIGTPFGKLCWQLTTNFRKIF